MSIKPMLPRVSFWVFVVTLWRALLYAGDPFPTGAVVSPEFEINLPATVPITFGSRESPAIAFNGEVHLAIWVFSETQEYHSVVGIRISKDGSVLDAGGIPISPHEIYVRVRAVASNGTNFLVVWNYGERLVGTRVTGDGKVLDRPGFTISQSTVWDGFLDVKIASNGSDYLVVSSQLSEDGDPEVRATRVTSAGQSLDADGILVRPGESPFAVASVGDDYLVAWKEVGSSQRIVGKRISGAGQVLDQAPIFLSQGHADTDASIATSENEYFVTWQSAGHIRANRINGRGEMLSPQDLSLVETWSSQPDVTASENGYLVTWQTEDDTSVYGLPLDHDGATSNTNGVPIVTGLTDGKKPGVAGDGEDFFVVWETRTNDWYSVILGTKVDLGAEAYATNAIQISREVSSQNFPAAASNGTNYLVVWNEGQSGYEIHGGRVSLTGESLDPNSIRISTPTSSGYAPDVASCAGNYLVVWQSPALELAAVQVSSSGEALDTNAIIITSATGWQLNPKVAANGSNYLVVWEQRINPDVYTRGDIRGALIGPDGVVLRTDIPICTASGLQQSPAVAASGGQYLVVWDDPRGVGMYRARVTGDGTVLDPDGMAIESNGNQQQYSPNVSTSPGGYLVLWEQSDDPLRPYSARIGMDGQVLDAPAPFLTQYGRSPAAASDGNRSLVLWAAGAGSECTTSFGSLVRNVDGGESGPLVINPCVSYLGAELAAGGNGGFLSVGQSEITRRIVGNVIWLIERPVVQIVRSPTTEILLSWPTEIGRTYRVEFTSDLGATHWNELPGEVAGTGGIASLTDSATPPGSQRFYRVTARVGSP